MSSEGRDAGVAIALRGLAKRYRLYEQPRERLWELLGVERRKPVREVEALRALDLEIRRGETLGIVGANGSGKSTLLRMICGTLEPSEGELVVHGEVAPLLSLGAGFHREFTGRENALMNATIQGMSSAEITARMPAIEAFAELGDFLDRPIKTYSTGMVARLAFALAVHCDPDILVIDEVLAVGDEAFNRKCFARIAEIQARGATIVFVSHVAERVIELCDRAVLLDRGEALCVGEPKGVIARYKKLVHAPAAKRASVREEIAANVSLDGVAESKVTVPSAPPLESRSRVEVRGERARILDPHLTDRHGAPTSQLVAGDEAHYRFEVDLLAPAHQVRFGMMIKLVTGAELAGQASHAAHEAIEKVAAGARLRVDFTFRAALAPGTYFMNAGVLAREAGASAAEEQYLHRVLDATMFRVVPGPANLATGRVDLTESDAPAHVEVVREGV